MEDLRKELQEFILPVLDSESVELVQLELLGRQGSQSLKVFIDSDSGVSLQKCTAVSRAISDKLDIVDLIKGKYRLEVSSPGINRPLRTFRDFQRNLNKEVEISLGEESKDNIIRGTLVEVSDKSIHLVVEDEQKEIAISAITQGKLSLPW